MSSIDIVPRLPQGLYRIDALDVNERRETLATVLRLVKQHNHITDSDDLPNAVRILAGVARDDDVECVVTACQVIETLVPHVENHRFAGRSFRSILIPQLLQAYDRDEQGAVDAISAAMDAFFTITTVSAIAENIMSVLQLKKPKVVNATLRYVTRCMSRSPFAPVGITAKMLAQAILPFIPVPGSDVVATQALGTLLRVVGPEPLMDTLRTLPTNDYKRVYATACEATVASPCREPIPEQLTPSKAAQSESSAGAPYAL